MDGTRAPLSPPKEGRWIARPDRTPWYLKLGASVAILAQLPNVLRIFLEPFVGKANAWPVMAALCAIFVLAAAFSMRRRQTRRNRERAAILDGGFGDQFAVDVTIVADGRHLGTDAGVLWFADGLMGFSGRASSFVLASDDVRAHRVAQSKRGRKPFPAGALQLTGASRYAYLMVTPSARDKKAYAERLRRFGLELAPPDAERHWPPLRPYGEDATLVRAAS